MTPRPRTRRSSRRSRWRGSTSTRTDSAGPPLPGDDLIAFKDQIEQLPVGEVPDTPDRDAVGQRGRRRIVQEHDRNGGVGIVELLRHGGERERAVLAREEMERLAHQNTMKRRPRLTS